MALPVTLPNNTTNNQPPYMRTNSYGGPFISSGGNVYLVTGGSNGSPNPTRFEVYKATDPTSAFSHIDGDQPFGSSTNVFSYWCVQDGDIIHIWIAKANAGNTSIYTHSTFNMSTDVLSADTEIFTDVDTTGSTTVAATGAVRSDGDKLLVYQGPEEKVMGTDYSRVYWARDEGGGWGSASELDALNGVEAHARWPVCVRGESDAIHVFWIDSNVNDVVHKRINSANSISTQKTASGANSPYLTATLSSNTPPRYYDTGGVERIAILRLTNTPNFDVIENHMDDEGTFTSDAFVGDTDGWPGTLALAVDGTTLYALFGDNSTQDLWLDQNDDAGGWGTDEEVLDAVTVNWVQANVIDRSGKKIAYVYDDGGTVKYNEYALVTTLELAPSPAVMNFQAVSPAVVGSGSVAAAPSPAVVNLQAVSPALVAAGAVTLTPTPAVINVSAVSPAMLVGEVTITPAPAVMNLVAVSPAMVAAGAAVLTPTPAVVNLQAVSPAMTAAGAVSLAPSPAVVNFQAVSPSLAVGEVSVIPTPAVFNLVAVSPSLTGAGAVTLTPSPAVVNLQAVSPVLSGAGSVSAAPAPATVNMVAVSPTLTPAGAAPLAPSPAVVNLAAVSPVLTGAGSVSITPSPAVINFQAVSPELIVAGVLSPTPAVINLQAVSPAMAAAGAVVLSPSPAVVNFAAVSPSLAVVGTPTLEPTPAAINFQAVSPAIVATGAVSLVPTPAVINLQAVNPSLAAAGNVTLAPDPAIINITAVNAGLSPAGSVSATAAPAVINFQAVSAALVVAGAAPLAPSPAILNFVAASPALIGAGSTSFGPPTPAVINMVAVSPSMAIPSTIGRGIPPAGASASQRAPQAGSSVPPRKAG